MTTYKNLRSSRLTKVSALIFSSLFLFLTIASHKASADDRPEREVFRFIVGSNDEQIAIWGDNVDVSTTADLKDATVRVPERFADVLNYINDIRTKSEKYSGGSEFPDVTVIVTIRGNSTSNCHYSRIQGDHCHSD